MRTTLAANLTLVTLTAALASGQAARPIPRTADGHPDLQGTYDIASMTPLERAPGTPLVMTKEEAVRLEQQRADRVRRHGAATAGRTLPAGIRIHLRTALASGALQQPPPDRADAELGDDPHRDGARHAHRPDEQRACAADGAEVARRFSGTLGWRCAGRGHDQLRRQDALQKLQREPARRRALLAHRRDDAALSVHDRGSCDV